MQFIDVFINLCFVTHISGKKWLALHTSQPENEREEKDLVLWYLKTALMPRETNDPIKQRENHGIAWYHVLRIFRLLNVLISKYVLYTHKTQLTIVMTLTCGVQNEVSVQCFPLYSILLALNQLTVDFFSLDVEGDELRVLKTIPFNKVSYTCCVFVVVVVVFLVGGGALCLKSGCGWSM